MRAADKTRTVADLLEPCELAALTWQMQQQEV